MDVRCRSGGRDAGRAGAPLLVGLGGGHLHSVMSRNRLALLRRGPFPPLHSAATSANQTNIVMLMIEKDNRVTWMKQARCWLSERP